MPWETLLNTLEQKDAMKILILILESDTPLTRTDLIEKYRLNRNTVLKRVKELAAAGLLYEKVSNTFPFTAKLYLTEKGRKVAEILKQLKELEEEQ
ncbi:MAG: winged helix-turn-helix transcriptional regulator [Candidatus Asgardarchaeia archaeon]